MQHFLGASKAMTVITTVDLLGLENLTKAYGLLLVFQGLGFFVGNPLAGKHRKEISKLNPYDSIFIFEQVGYTT